MLSITTLSVIVGVSSVLGFLALLAYLYFVSTLRRVERSAREAIEGEGLFNADQIIRILEQFEDDAARLEALRELTNLDTKKAQALLRKVKANVDVNQLQRLSASSHRKIAGSTASFFLALAAIGIVYTLQQEPEPPIAASLPPANVIEAKWAISVPVPQGWSGAPCPCFSPTVLPIPQFPLAPNSFIEIPNMCRTTVETVLVKDLTPPPGGLPMIARESVPVKAVLKADFSGAYRFGIVVKECPQ